MYSLMKTENNKFSSEEIGLINSVRETVINLFQKNELVKEDLTKKLNQNQHFFDAITGKLNQTIIQLTEENELQMMKNEELSKIALNEKK